jgi:hypothetical protein
MLGIRASPTGRYLLILLRGAPSEIWAVRALPCTSYVICSPRCLSCAARHSAVQPASLNVSIVPEVGCGDCTWLLEGVNRALRSIM